MKTVSDDLYRLIKSLNKSEKGYFKKFAAKNEAGSKQNYIHLFDALDAMDEYDETLLKKKLKNESFTKQLPVYKVYLFNLILRSLSPNSVLADAGTKMKELIENSKILSSKALYREALKQLKKAKELARKFSNHLTLLDVLIAERNILAIMPDKNISEMRKNLYEEQLDAINKLKKNMEYSWLSDQMVICVEQKGDFTVDERSKEMDKIMQMPLLKIEDNAEDLNMMFYLLHTKLFYHLGKNELVEVKLLLEREIELLEANRHFIDDNPRNYSSALINYLMFSQITGFRKDVLASLTKLNALRRKLKNKVPLSLQLQISFHAANSEMLVYKNSVDIRRGRNLVKRMETDLPKYGNEIPPQLRISLISNIASFLVMDGDHEAALKFNNRLLEESGLNFKSDVYLFGRLLNLVIHYGLGNYDLLEYNVESTYKFFREKNALKKAESIIFAHFKRLLRADQNEHKELFKELHFNLNKLPMDNNTQNLFTMLNFAEWAYAESEGITMAEAAKRNNTQTN
jgi:hypothetical protein